MMSNDIRRGRRINWEIRSIRRLLPLVICCFLLNILSLPEVQAQLDKVVVGSFIDEISFGTCQRALSHADKDMDEKLTANEFVFFVKIFSDNVIDVENFRDLPFGLILLYNWISCLCTYSDSNEDCCLYGNANIPLDDSVESQGGLMIFCEQSKRMIEDIINTPSPVVSPIQSETPTISTLLPSNDPSFSPSFKGSFAPSFNPSLQPSTSPTRVSSSIPTLSLSIQPSDRPSLSPTYNTSVEPSYNPSKSSSFRPSQSPSTNSTITFSITPTFTSSLKPPASPSITNSETPTLIAIIPSSSPSCEPSVEPSYERTLFPSSNPSKYQSSHPSTKPSKSPSLTPSSPPSLQSSSKPSLALSTTPSLQLSEKPSQRPSPSPSGEPTQGPSLEPSQGPSPQPTQIVSLQPSQGPSPLPSRGPSPLPSQGPSSQPSQGPSPLPSQGPSSQPSQGPSLQPSYHPSSQPTIKRSSVPSVLPSFQSSLSPSTQPTQEPTNSSRPSSQPSLIGSYSPSGSPTVEGLLCINFLYTVRNEANLTAYEILNEVDNTLKERLVVATEITMINILNESYPFRFAKQPSQNKWDTKPNQNLIQSRIHLRKKGDNILMDKFNFEKQTQETEFMGVRRHLYSSPEFALIVEHAVVTNIGKESIIDFHSSSGFKSRLLSNHRTRRSRETQYSDHNRRLVIYSRDYPATILGVTDAPIYLCNGNNIGDLTQCAIVSSSVCILMGTNDKEEDVRTVVNKGLRDAVNSGEFQINIPSEGDL